MASQDLEDYASGLGGGALPQQGSMLPAVTPPPAGPSALGTQPAPVAPSPAFRGLPLGQSPLVPPTGMAPLLSLGGQPAPLEQMIQQRLQTVQQYNPADLRPAASDAYLYALKELPLLQQQASIKSQARDLQMKALTDLATHAKDFSALPPEQQQQQGPLYQKLLQARAQIAGLDLSPEDVQHVFSSPDLANQYASVLNDALIPKDQAVARLGSVAAGKPREDALGQIQAEATQRALGIVQQYLPQAVAKYGGTPDKPLDAATLTQKLQSDPELGQYLQSSPSLTKALNTFLTDKNNAETLAGWGVKPGKVTLEGMLKSAAGPELTGEVKDVLATMKGPDGKPLTPATVMVLPNGAQLIAQARQKVFEDKLDISGRQGYQAVVVKAQAERTVPLVQVPGMADVHIVNKATEMPVDRLQTSLDALQKGGGEEKFAVMNGKSYEAFAAAKEADGILGQYLDLSRALTTTPGANFGQALTMYAKTKMGVDNPGVAFNALQGTILRMARAMQGSSQSLSNLDANSVAGMLPSTQDTAQTAIRRLEIAAQIVQNMKDTQLGKMPPTKLMDQIAQAKNDIAKLTSVVITDGKVKAVIPKGQSVPKGWKVVE